MIITPRTHNSALSLGDNGASLFDVSNRCDESAELQKSLVTD